MGDLLADAMSQAASLGLVVDGLVLDGAWHRVPVDSKKKHNLAGAYCLSELRLRNDSCVVVGMITNWVTGAEVSLTLDSVVGATEDEMARAREQARAAALASKQAKALLQAETADRALDIWSKLPSEGRSAYLDRKQVRGWGLAFSRGSVVVPVRDVAGKLWSLQFINAEGNKRFLTGGAKRSHFHFLIDGHALTFATSMPAQPPAMIGIAEGFSTAASVFEALDAHLPMAVAFDAGNLRPVAVALRARYPTTRLVVFADDDRHGGYPQAFIRQRDVTPEVRAVIALLATQRPDAVVEVVVDADPRLRDPHKRYNVGLSKALLAAAAVDGFVILPRFGELARAAA